MGSEALQLKRLRRCWRTEPGDYRCTLTNDGDLAAEFLFRVDAQGKIVDGTCGGVTSALARRHLIQVKFKRGFNAPYNARAFASQGLYGKKLPNGCPPTR